MELSAGLVQAQSAAADSAIASSMTDGSPATANTMSRAALKNSPNGHATRSRPVSGSSLPSSRSNARTDSKPGVGEEIVVPVPVPRARYRLMYSRTALRQARMIPSRVDGEMSSRSFVLTVPCLHPRSSSTRVDISPLCAASSRWPTPTQTCLLRQLVGHGRRRRRHRPPRLQRQRRDPRRVEPHGPAAAAERGDLVRKKLEVGPVEVRDAVAAVGVAVQVPKPVALLLKLVEFCQIR